MNIIVLDFGSGKITGVLAIIDKNTDSVKIESQFTLPVKDISGGMVLSIRPVAAAIEAVINRLTLGSGKPFHLICGLRGEYLSLQRACGFKNILDCDTRTITDEDVNLALENSVPQNIREKNYTLVSVLPQTYTIDGKEGIKDPVGMSGFMLEAQCIITAAFSSHFDNLSKCIARAGVEDYTFYPATLALCETLLTEDERELGCVLIDFGAEITSYVFYHHNNLIAHGEINLGPNLIDRDIAYITQNTLVTAKKMKEEYKFGDDELLDDVIRERVSEIFQKIHAPLMNVSLFLRMPPPYMVLCGGGSQLDSITDIAKDYFKIKKVRLGTCQSIEVSAPSSSEEYTAALALISSYHKNTASEEWQQAKILFPDLLKKIKKMLDGVF